jgi:hypothetical protein
MEIVGMLPCCEISATTYTSQKFRFAKHVLSYTNSKEKKIFKFLHPILHNELQKLQFLPYGRSIGSWICLRLDLYMSHVKKQVMRAHSSGRVL